MSEHPPATIAHTSRWIQRPWLDLTVGCGGWSAPLLLAVYVLAPPEQRLWAIAFYGLAVLFNYPHFMATIYRAYGTQRDFSKYRVFTVHLTAFLFVTGLVVHTWTPLIAWIFTLYITWSPWHYTGQNYGLLMMFVRRNGGAPSLAERHALYGSFVASYVMLFLAFHSGSSNDPLVLSLGIPDRWALAGQLTAMVVFTTAGGWALWRLTRRLGVRAMTPALTLFVTQVLWFVLPTALERSYGLDTPQSRYSSGMLAILHSTQYLWITTYYARREATSNRGRWRPWSYGVSMVVGGIALFIPGPWVVSYLFRYDFATTFIVFTAVVNIHHFLLDGAIWKLRDGRIASLLLDTRDRVGAAADEITSAFGSVGRWASSQARAARTVRAGVAAGLVVIAAVDLGRYAYGLGDTASRLEFATRLNPYDSVVQTRLGRTLAQTGDLDRAVGALERAVSLAPTSLSAQHTLGRILIEHGQYREARAHYARMLTHVPNDSAALVNLGILANQLGFPDEALASWRGALAIDPELARVQLYVAELLDDQGDARASLPHYEAFLTLAAGRRGASRPDPGRVIPAALRLADAHARLGQPDDALQLYRTAATMAAQTKLAELESLARGAVAEILEQRGDVAEAARAYQQAIVLDRAASDTEAEGIHLFNYGQLLRRAGAAPRLAYACFVHSAELLADGPGDVLDAIVAAREEAASQLGTGRVQVGANVETDLATALTLSAAAFDDRAQ